MLGNESFDRARRQANEVADYMRRMGPFEPERLPTEAMEYTTLPQVAEQLAERWQPIEEPVPATTHV
jgi:fructose 1,6-bisphosphate aldolase/phosphatase